MHLFYLEKEKLLTNLVEILFKEVEDTVFTTDDLDCLHLIDDQKPEIILIGLGFNISEIQNILSSIRDLPAFNFRLGILGKKEEIEEFKKVANADFYIQKPFQAIMFLDMLK